jgi:hypothetical protein
VARWVCEKIARNSAQPIFLSESVCMYIAITMGRCSPKVWLHLYFCHFPKKYLPKENIRPIGENSPNLATLRQQWIVFISVPDSSEIVRTNKKLKFLKLCFRFSGWAIIK